jgi:hypothetical protein
MVAIFSKNGDNMGCLGGGIAGRNALQYQACIGAGNNEKSNWVVKKGGMPGNEVGVDGKYEGGEGCLMRIGV